MTYKDLKADLDKLVERISILEKAPGKEALLTREKWKWVLIGSIFGLPVTVYATVCLIKAILR